MRSRKWALVTLVILVVSAAVAVALYRHEQRHPRPIFAKQCDIVGWTQHDLARECVTRARWIADNHDQHREACKQALDLLHLVGFVSSGSRWREIDDIAYAEARNLVGDNAPPWDDLSNRLAILSKRLDDCQNTDAEFYNQMMEIPITTDDINLNEQEDYKAATEAAEMMNRAIEVEEMTGNSFPVSVAKFAERRAKAAIARRREVFFGGMAGSGGDQSFVGATSEAQQEREQLEREAKELYDQAVLTYTTSYEQMIGPDDSMNHKNHVLERALKRAMRLPSAPESYRQQSLSPSASAPAAKPAEPPAVPSQSVQAQLDGPVFRLSRRVTVPGASTVVFSHDGSRFIVMSHPPDNPAQDVWLDCFAMETGRSLFRAYNGDFELNPMQAIFSPDDRVIYHQRRSRDGRQRGPCAISADNGETLWWRAEDGNETGGLAVSPDGRYLAAAERDCLVGSLFMSGCIYRADTGRTEAKLRKAKMGYSRFLFSPKGSFMAEQTGEGLRVVGTDDWMLRYAREEIQELAGNCHDGLAGTVRWGADCQLRILDWNTGKTLAKHRVPHLRVVSPSLKWYVKEGGKAGLEIRSLSDDQSLQRLLTVDPTEMYICDLSDDGKWLAIGQGDEVLILRAVK